MEKYDFGYILEKLYYVAYTIHNSLKEKYLVNGAKSVFNFIQDKLMWFWQVQCCTRWAIEQVYCVRKAIHMELVMW